MEDPIVNPARHRQSITPAHNDPYDQPYTFGKPLTYLSARQQARLLILRARLAEPLVGRRTRRHGVYS
jgi:hypothetical protein